MALSSWHVAVVGGALIGIVAIWSLVQQPTPTRRQLLAIGGSAVLVALVVAPIAVPYTHLAAWRLRQSADQRQRALNRHAVAVDEFLPRQLVLGPPNEPAHGNARARWTFPGIVTWGLACAAFLPHRGSLRRRGVFGGESAAAMLALAMLGLLLAGASLAALGWTGLMQALLQTPLVVLFVMAFLTWSLLRARRQAFEEHSMDPVARERRARLVYATVAALGAIVALGPRASAWGVDLGSGLYRPDVVPLLSVLRTPERFGLLFAFGLAVLSGFGALRLVGLFPSSARAPLFAAVFVLLNVDLRPAPIDVAEEPGPGAGHEWLRTFPEPGAVVELPAQEWELPMIAGYAHGRRIVNGIGYVYPPGYLRMKGIPEFDPLRFDVLWERFHPRFVLLHGRFYDKRGFERVMRAARSRADALTIVAQPGVDVVFRLKDRGRGSLLHRRWPREALSGTSGLALSAVVGGGRDGRDDRLVISLNDRLLYELEGAALREGALRHVPFQSEWLVPGENRFDILADYRYGAGQAPNAIGQTGVSVAADLHARADGSGAWYQVNGDRREVPPGYTLLAIDPATGRVLTRGVFDTARREADSAALARFVHALAPSTPVVVVSEGDVSARLTGDAVAALHALGLREDLRGRRRWVHAAVGVEGRAERYGNRAGSPRQRRGDRRYAGDTPRAARWTGTVLTMSLSPSPSDQAAPTRTIGFSMAVALVMGNMIGSGIFLLPASLAPFGGVSLIGWLVSTVGAVLIALVFARLSSLHPAAGGLYAYTRLGFGDLAGFLVGWGYWISTWCTLAAIAVAFVGYLDPFFPARGAQPGQCRSCCCGHRVAAHRGEHRRCPGGRMGAARDHGPQGGSAHCRGRDRVDGVRARALHHLAERCPVVRRSRERDRDAHVVGVSGSGMRHHSSRQHP